MKEPVCPIPFLKSDHIQIGHGSGGLLTRDLICSIFYKHLGNALLNTANDGAVIENLDKEVEGQTLVTATDAHIVSPLFFPGGDIGRLAVCGTVNDVSMMGADPRYLTATFILEEGFPVKDLERIVQSMAKACSEARVTIIAGDTKVTEKGKSDGLFISTTGIGWVPSNRKIAGDQARVGDVVIVTGPLGNHGVAVLQARGNLGFQADVQSDVAPLNHLVRDLCQALPSIHVLRDPTRGGLATTLVEISEQSNCTIQIIKEEIPVDQPVRTVCELLGLDPLYLANEGKMVLILPAEDAQKALEICHRNPNAQEAVVIGIVMQESAPRVWLKTALGTNRILEMLAGEMLPRIC